MTDETDAALHSALQRLQRFAQAHPLTAGLAQLEWDLAGATGVTMAARAGTFGIDADLLRSAITVREAVGRINDLIHAASIVLIAQRILEPDEVLKRPSLAAGNDPTRLFDLETDRRVAEFKLSQWRGADAARKRQTFKDLVELAAEPSDRRAQLYVLGPRPLQFLRHSTSSAAWALAKSPTVLIRFAEHFGSPESISVAEFTAGMAAEVDLVDLAELAPDLFVASSE